MASSPSLKNLAPEIIEMIDNHLELLDICRLRFATGAFERYCQRKKINIDTNQLQHAISVMQGKQFSYLLGNLTLVAIPANSHQGNAVNPPPASGLVQELLETICLSFTRGHLPNLTLTVRGTCPQSVKNQSIMNARGPDPVKRPSVWKAAGERFDATMRALAATKFPIEHLDIFASTLSCSLACNQITTTLSTLNVRHLSESLTGLKKLCLSLSPHEWTRGGIRHYESSEYGRRQTSAVCQFLQLCPNLIELQLHWYKAPVGMEPSDALTEEKYFFDRVAESCQFPLLEILTLEGITTTETALLSVLRKVRLRRLVMENVHLSIGRFRSIFDYLFEHMRHAELHFDNLWEGRLIGFDGPGRPHFPSSGRGPDGPNFIVRTGQELSRRAIGYRHTRGRALGSPACAIWMRKRKLKYGPW